MTAAFALAMVLVLVAAALFVYLSLQSNLNDTINGGLNSRSDDAAAVVRGSGPGLGEGNPGRLAESDEAFVQVLTPDGRFIDGTSPAREPAIPVEDVRQALRGPTMVEREVAEVDHTARMLARPVATERGFVVVVAGASLEDRDDALSGLVKSFLIGGPIAVLIASGIGYMLASVGFRPVEAMRRRAEQISMARGGERLPLPKAHDEIRRLGETLNEMIARLEASFQKERQFVADASHELRTPLAVMKAELEAAIRTSSGQDARESLVAALEETDNLAQLAEDLLLIARAADGHLPVRREKVLMHELLERSRDRFSDRAREQGREIKVNAPETLTANMDPVRGRQAIGNLVDNALRHGAGAIELSARENGDAVEIDVSDSGAGFSAELAPHAFERFTRGDSARSRGGAGLGLSIVRVVAEAHGGTVSIVEAASSGATVRLRIPLSAGVSAGS